MMRRRGPDWRPAAVLAALLFAAVAAAADPADRLLVPPESRSPAYTGSLKCATCHQIQYKGWQKTFHATVIQDTKKNPGAILADMTVPDLPFKKDEIHFAIGGHWDQRYLTRIDDDYYILPRLWSIQSNKWRPYSTYGWQKRPYSKYCIGCHSVGFDPKSKTIVEHAVGCESCHGPGAAHAAKPEKINIVNPKRLQPDRAADVCAACHVRGKDTTGEYFFPIGYRPGFGLSDFLNPIERVEGQSNYEAIQMAWGKWRADREQQARSRCEVCGIHQSTKPKGATASIDAICMSCHEYGDDLPKHTRHKAGTQIGCADCHQQKPQEMNESKEVDVHSYGYFLIHPRGCWDTEIYKRCVGCHGDKTEGWAYDIFVTWKKPFVVDH